ncbi:MAG: replication-associated recombination protein A [Candidatus Eiseniibacteriota bacterium]
MDLFDPGSSRPPLAERMRPRTFDEVVGQDAILGPGGPFDAVRRGGEPVSLILWGPPGSGKTTIARLVAGHTKCPFVAFSAVTSGIKEIKQTIERARQNRRTSGRPTILFVDEIHRFNRAQQDAFLPHIEDGSIVLIGATTENPSFEVNSALLSRTRVLVLEPLAETDVRKVLERALADTERGLGDSGVTFDPAAVDAAVRHADGDARRGLNALELAVAAAKAERRGRVTVEELERALQRSHLRYDKSGEEHYNLISALHKSLRDSDPDGALYWLARMLSAGEEPLYVARRLVRFASEDVGNADPRALQIAQAAADAYHFLGSPEGELAIAQSAVYLATAPKSNAVYRAFGRAREAAEQHGSLPVPLHLRNAVTSLMKEVGYGKGYRYAHDFPEHVVEQEHLPKELAGTRFYEPSDQGEEAAVRERLQRWRDAIGRA